jgi:hypothetical protein
MGEGLMAGEERSEVFDPHNVERVEANANFDNEGWYQCTVVQASDYETLLRMHEELRESFSRYIRAAEYRLYPAVPRTDAEINDAIAEWLRAS